VSRLRTLVVGLGQMGQSHALAYHRNSGFEIIGFVNRTAVSLPAQLAGYRMFDDFQAGLAAKPDLVSVNTYTETHAAHAIAAMEAGAHVFVEKPLAPSVVEAERVVAAARRTGRKLVIGYILRHHPSYVEFIRQARTLGLPVVMRMNLNQQSSGEAWDIHKRLMQSTSPVVDCGVHYIDVMLQITDSRPVQVRGMGVRLSSEIAETQVNYGHLQVIFEDGSLGWYEAGVGTHDLGDRVLRQGRDGSARRGVDRDGRGSCFRERRHAYENGPDPRASCRHRCRRRLRHVRRAPFDAG
jgi:predicted dehydrogenase